MAEPKIFVWQWGRFGSGPRIAFELARAMRQQCGMDVLLSLSRGADIFASTICRDAVDLPINTYDTLAEFAARTLLYRRHLAPVFAHLEHNRPTVALSVMPGYWDLFMMRHLRRLGVPVTTIVHDASNHPGDRLQLIHWIQKAMIKESTAIVTLTDFIAQRLGDRERLEHRKHQTIAHPALTFPDLKLSEPQPPGFPGRVPLRLLLTGRLRKYQGVDLLLQAISMIDPALIQVRIAGGLDNQKLIARALNLANVEVKSGWMSEQEYVSHLDWSDVVVLPYTEASQSGIAPTAFARRRPVIVTPVGGLPEQVGHEITGLVTESVSPEAVANAIKHLLKSPDFLHKMAENAYRKAQNDLSPNEIGRQFAEFLSEISTK